MIRTLCICICLLLFFGFESHAQADKPRLLITTDIGGDPDDTQSLIRLMLYANDFEIEGLIASASGTPGELRQAVVKPELILGVIEAYGEVQPSLRLHDSFYPSVNDLRSVVKRGNPQRGWDFVGAGHDTEGSDWIIRCVDHDEGKLNICIWGGQTDLAQALWKVKNSRTREAYRQFIDKIRIYDIADQDDIFERIWSEHPGLFYILNKAREGEDKRNAAFRGMYLGGDESLTSLEWLKAHVINDHGSLGARYPQKTWTAPNPHGAMKEGDTPSWFYFLDNGLQEADHPSFGGWGGRFVRSEEGYYTDAEDDYDGLQNARTTVSRWRVDFQHELAARMDWCVKSKAAANHAPEAVINGDRTNRILRIKVASGEKVRVDAFLSNDIDGDPLVYEWFVYSEPGHLKSQVELKVRGPVAEIEVPNLTGAEAIHLILSVRDLGEPSLASYRRVVISH